MKNILLLFLIISTISSQDSFAQTGPAGVGSVVNNELWLIAENNTYVNAGTANGTNGSSILQWSDISGNSNHAIQNTNWMKPTLRVNDLNGYSTLRFDGNDDRILSSNIDGSNSQLTIFSVIQFNSLNNHNNGVIHAAPSGSAFSSSASSKSVGMWINSNNKRIWGRAIQSNGSIKNLPQVTALNTNRFYSVTQDFNGSRIAQFINGTFSNSINYNNTLKSWADFGIGRQGTESMNGDIAELIVYKRHVNTAERIIIENYLTAKYGLALARNNLYTQDNAGNGNFDHNVAGIGQATDGTNHTDSRGSGIVRMHTPSTLSNGDYLFWGEETKDPTYNFTTNPANYIEQLNSKWRVSKANNLGNVTVVFDVSGMDLSGKQNCQPLQLVIDNNEDFTSETSYDLTISGTTATATGVSFTDGDYFTLRYVDQIVWDGTTFFNGSGTGDSPDNTNGCLKLTVKTGAVGTLTSNAHVREIEVENGGIINVSDGILLEVDNQIEINGTIDLLGEAQLIQNHMNTTSNSGTGELRVSQQGVSNLNNYNYWSSPVNRSGAWQIGYLEDGNGVVNFTTAANANPTTSPITLSSRWLYDFNAVSGEYAGWNVLTTTSNLTPGRGYTMKGSGAITTEQKYLFKGIPNDGNYAYNVVANNDFLIGNPYPSALNAEKFIKDNLSVINGTLYFWEHFKTNNSHNLAAYEGGYATYNLMMSLPAIADDSGLTSGSGTASRTMPTGNIAVGQGFFVTIENAGSLVFNNEQRIFAKESENETIFYRNSNPENSLPTNDDRFKIWLSFKEPAEHIRIIGLGYDVNASEGYDKGYDAKSYDDQRNELYWLLNDKKLCIQALPQFDNAEELPLGIKITDAGAYTFGIDDLENVPSDVTVYLKDNFDNSYHNISNGAISIWLEAVTDHTRFSIVFQEENTLTIDEEFLSDVHLIYDNTSNLLTIKNLQKSEIKQLSIYNTVGQLVLDRIKDNVSPQINIGEFKDGVYILKIKTNKGIENIKFIKH